MSETGTPQGVTRYRKKPVTVETMPWTGDNFAAVREFAGDSAQLLTQPYLGLPDVLEVWNDQESAWIPCPVGHSVVKGRLGEFYPISPAAIAETYEPADGDQVTVSREDLRALLADNELTTEAAQVAYGRLSAAAGDPQ